MEKLNSMPLNCLGIIKRHLRGNGRGNGKTYTKILKSTEPKSSIVWVSATKTRNYALKDPLLDYLNLYGSQLEPDFRFREYIYPNFTEYIMQQGLEFEKYIFDNLSAIFEKNLKEGCILNLSDFIQDSELAFQKTLDAMENGIPVIYQGCVKNYTNFTYGYPDLLIRADCIKYLVRDFPDIWKIEDSKKNPYFKPVNSKLPKEIKNLYPRHSIKVECPYVVVDIKFSILNLRANGINLLNSGSIPAYKTQLAIYNLALGEIQGLLPDCAFILGRRWNYTASGKFYSGNGPFEKLGVINFNGCDASYYTTCTNAVNWINTLRNEGFKWKIYDEFGNISRPELYPNMSNQNDYPWRRVKKEISCRIKEITSLWNCGIKQRDIAHSQGIYSWLHPKCTSETLGFNNGKIAMILDKIIDINRSPEKCGPLHPQKIKYNERNWQKKHSVEFYVDFETTHDFGGNPSLIYLIGCGYISIESEWVFKAFILNELTLEEEFRIISEWLDYIETICKILNATNEQSLIFHWSPAEKNFLNSAIKRHLDRNIPEVFRKIMTWNKLNWFDAMDIFMKEPITVVGATSFGLKNIANAMKELGFINTIWKDNEVDGINGMAIILHLQKIMRENGQGSLSDFSIIKEIINYNEVDCKVIYEIIHYLRINHC